MKFLHIIDYVNEKINTAQNIFVSNAYKNVIDKIDSMYSYNENVSESKINQLNITDNMKQHLISFLYLGTPKNSPKSKSREIKEKDNKQDDKQDNKQDGKQYIYNELININGIGRVLANKLINMGLEDINELYDKYYDILSLETKCFLNHEPITKIKKETIDKIYEKLSHDIKGINILGSYARDCKYSSDIDILLPVGYSIDKFIIKLDKKYKFEVYSRGGDKASMIFYHGKNCYKLDVFATISKYERIFMTLYMIGSKQFNIRMRSIAKHKGYILNQKGLYKGSKQIVVKSEKDVFNILNMEYVAPSCR